MYKVKVDVFKLPQRSPDDLSGLDNLIQTQQLDPTTIIAILGKTEGNGCVNDFTRGFATQTLKLYLSQYLETEAAQQVVYIMSGGTEGVLSPHINVFTRRDDLPNAPKQWGLVMGTHRTRAFSPEEIGSMEMVDTVAHAVKAAVQEVGLTPEHVHFVQIKCPLVQSSQNQTGTASSSYQSMADSRGASALGVALALGEIQPCQLQPESICQDFSLYSKVASTSAGVELQTCEILILGNAAHSTSNLIVGHDVMQHALDTESVNRAIASTGQSVEQVVNVFAKAEADPSGLILGRRHTMLDDSDISHTRMARAVVGSVIASLVQDPMVYVSGGSEHQGPPGGGPVAVIVTQ